MQLLDFIAVLSSALISAFVAMYWIRTRPDIGNIVAVDDPDQVLLFEGNVLFHASQAAYDAFGMGEVDIEWDNLRDQILPRFPSFPSSPEAAYNGDMSIPAADAYPPGNAVLSFHGNKTRVAIHDGQTKTVLNNVERAELDILRRINVRAHNPTWLTDRDGQRIWQNPAFEKLLSEVSLEPDQQLFALDNSTYSSQRVKVSDHSISRWFEVKTTLDQEGKIFEATQIDAVIQAEEAQRNFVQTLAKTFAHLSIGLAIFDKHRQLALFNPALVDLTSLSAEFLSTRPTLISFFDRLRDSRTMPEPKNYTTWRQEIAKVIAEADHGNYQEVWTLESGQTYRVTGRPHPDGATAFLIEDISAEVSLTRNYRAELELSECLLDSVEDALVVFSRSGALTFSNTAFRELWQIDADTSFAEYTITDAIRVWSKATDSTLNWQEVEDFVLGRIDRGKWDMPVKVPNRAALSCSIQPIVSGATLVRFCKQPVNDQNIPKAKQNASLNS